MPSQTYVDFGSGATLATCSMSQSREATVSYHLLQMNTKGAALGLCVTEFLNGEQDFNSPHPFSVEGSLSSK